MTLWMEVDLKNNELPTGRMSTTSAELSRMCGLNPRAVADAVRKARLQGRKCKYVRVEIDEEDSDETP